MYSICLPADIWHSALSRCFSCNVWFNHWAFCTFFKALHVIFGFLFVQYTHNLNVTTCRHLIFCTLYTHTAVMLDLHPLNHFTPAAAQNIYQTQQYETSSDLRFLVGIFACKHECKRVWLPLLREIYCIWCFPDVFLWLQLKPPCTKMFYFYLLQNGKPACKKADLWDNLSEISSVFI